MDRQPTLQGETLLLRPLREEDIEPLFAIAKDRLLWAQHPVPERAEWGTFKDWMVGKLAAEGTLVAKIREGAPVACSTYSNLRSEGGGAVEIGSTFVARRCWGSSVNPELKRLMLSHAFASVGRVEFLIWEHNLRSRRAVEKIGASLTGRVVTITDRRRDIPHLIYEMTRDDFASGRLGGPWSA